LWSAAADESLNFAMSCISDHGASSVAYLESVQVFPLA
jgi:hypothetical protein